MSAPLSPTLVNLKKTYRFAESVSEKTEDYGLLLWRLIASQVAFSLPSSVREDEVAKLVVERLTNYIVARMVTRGVAIEKYLDLLPHEMAESEKAELRDSRYATAVDDILNVSAKARADIVWFLTKIGPRVRKGGGALTGAQLGQVVGVATREQHRCYICGMSLSFPSAPHPTRPASSVDRREFQAEHIFSQARGGSRNRQNIASACQSCNAYKNELISYSDLPVELLSFADLPVEAELTSSDDSTTVKKRVGGGRVRFAILWRQGGACGTCDTRFHDCADETLFLAKRNPDDIYHFFNMMIVCRACIDGKRTTGVQIRE